MSEYCTTGCLENVPKGDTDALFNRIRRKLGAPVMGVELRDEQLEECFCEAIEEYSSFINNWVMTNRLGEMLGMPSEVDFTLKYISNSLYFEKSFGKAYAEQAGLGAEGTRPIKTDYINLTGGTQVYTIPAHREINEVLWFTPSFINLYGLDPFANTNKKSEISHYINISISISASSGVPSLRPATQVKITSSSVSMYFVPSFS